jgi:hypothetical protein
LTKFFYFELVYSVANWMTEAPDAGGNNAGQSDGKPPEH